MSNSPYDALRKPTPEGGDNGVRRPDAMTHSSNDEPLSDHQIDKLWRQNGLSGVIRKMERRESWAVDGVHKTPRSMEESTRILNEIAEAASDGEGLRRIVSNEKLILRFMGHIKTGRAVALFRFLMDRSPTSAIQLLRRGINEKEDIFVALLSERVRALEKSRVLSRVFAPERVAAVLEALDDTTLDFK